jgi:hypothetical protein
MRFSPIMFLMVVGDVMNKVIWEKKKKGIDWGVSQQLEDLDFTDDICLVLERPRC